MSKNTEIAKSTFKVMCITSIGFILGFIVQIMIANRFGATKEVDAFVIATIIPQLIYGLTNAVLMTSLVVVLTNYLIKNGKKKAWLFASNIGNISLILLIFLSILIFLLAPFLAKIIAPGFELERLDLTIKLIKILSITILFYGLSSFTTGVLYTRKQFIMPALFKPFISVGIIISILFLSNNLNIFSLAIGTVIGIGAGLMAQLGTLLKSRINYSLTLNLHQKEIKKLMLLSAPLIVASFFFYLNKYVNQIIASTLPEGNIAVLNYAFLLISFPVIFFGVSIGTVIFPSLIEYAAKKNITSFKILLTKILRILFFIFIPLTILLILLGNSLIRLLFEHGLFQTKDTMLTTLVFLCYSLGLIFFGIESIISSTFYAFKKMKLMACLAGMMVLINIILSLLLVKPFASAGLALATTLTYLIVVSISLFMIHISICKLTCKKLTFSLIKILIASFLMGCTVLVIYRPLLAFQFSRLSEFIIFISLFMFGATLYFALTTLLNLDEINLIKTILKNLDLRGFCKK